MLDAEFDDCGRGVFEHQRCLDRIAFRQRMLQVSKHHVIAARREPNRAVAWNVQAAVQLRHAHNAVFDLHFMQFDGREIRRAAGQAVRRSAVVLDRKVALPTSAPLGVAGDHVPWIVISPELNSCPRAHDGPSSSPSARTVTETRDTLFIRIWKSLSGLGRPQRHLGSPNCGQAFLRLVSSLTPPTPSRRSDLARTSRPGSARDGSRDCAPSAAGRSFRGARPDSQSGSGGGPCN